MGAGICFIAGIPTLGTAGTAALGGKDTAASEPRPTDTDTPASSNFIFFAGFAALAVFPALSDVAMARSGAGAATVIIDGEVEEEVGAGRRGGPVGGGGDVDGSLSAGRFLDSLRAVIVDLEGDPK